MKKILLIVFLALVLCIAAVNIWLKQEEIRETFAPQIGKKIVLDPGHGTPDGGAVGSELGSYEAGLNLAIAQKLEKILLKAGYDVIMTRTTDTQIGSSKNADMAARRKIIEESGQLLTISIHQNFYEGDRSVRGPQVFYAPGSEQGKLLAAAIQRELNAQTDFPRTEHEGDYYIVKSGSVPAVIVECGFLSNAEEELHLNRSQYQVRLAKAIFAGIESYLTPAG